MRQSRSVVYDSLRPHGLYSPWNSPGRNTAVGSLFLLQGIFPTQGSNPGVPHCRQILYQLNYKGSPRTLVGSPCLLQGIFPNQGSNPGLLHCGQILYQLGHKGSAAAKSLQSCPTLCDPIDGSPAGCLVPGILQARTLEWVAISFSNA